MGTTCTIYMYLISLLISLFFFGGGGGGICSKAKRDQLDIVSLKSPFRISIRGKIGTRLVTEKNVPFIHFFRFDYFAS